VINQRDRVGTVLGLRKRRSLDAPLDIDLDDLGREVHLPPRERVKFAGAHRREAADLEPIGKRRRRQPAREVKERPHLLLRGRLAVSVAGAFAQSEPRERVALNQSPSLGRRRVIEHGAQRGHRPVAATSGKPLGDDLIVDRGERQCPVSRDKVLDPLAVVDVRRLLRPREQCIGRPALGERCQRDARFPAAQRQSLARLLACRLGFCLGPKGAATAKDPRDADVRPRIGVIYLRSPVA